MLKFIHAVIIYSVFVLFCTLSTTPSQAGVFQINAGTSGSWYDPSHSGEGFIIEIISDDIAVVYWFTYTPTGEQAWLIGVGDISADKLDVEEFVQISGPTFGDTFDPNDRVPKDWGSAHFTFSSCAKGRVEYSGPPAWGDGTLKLERLIAVTGFDCVSSIVAQFGDGISGVMSGSWFDPTHAGEGFILEVLDEKSAVAYWFTYDPQGNQAWFISVGRIEDNRIIFDEVVQFSGPSFGPNYDRQDLNDRIWGSMQFAFGTCTGGAMRYQSIVGYGAGTQFLTRLTQLASSQCAGNVVSGEVLAAQQTDVDGDVNDPNVEEIDNNEFAQVVGNPIVVGGFATKKPTGGETDRFSNTTDDQDGYILPLAKGQTIKLLVSDHNPDDQSAVDLDLYLFEVNGSNEPVATSLGLTEIESVRVPVDGQYFIIVFAYNGTSNYTLSVAPPGESLSTKSFGIEDAFVPGQVIIKTDGTKGLMMENAFLKGLSNKLGGRVIAWQPGVASLLAFDVSGDRKSANLDRLIQQLLPRGEIYSSMNLEKLRTLALVKELAGRAGIEYAEPNLILKLQAVPSDPLYPYQWHYPFIDLPAAWELSMGENVTVAVVDTGVLLDHPDLSPNLTAGYDFVELAVGSGDGNGPDGNPNDPGQGPFPGAPPRGSHGTHVAGTVAAALNAYGMVGVAPEAEIVPVRVVGTSGAGTSYAIAQGIRFATGLPNISGTRARPRADIINLSLGGRQRSETQANAIRAAINNGTIVVAAAGNDGERFVSYPAALNGVFAVSAINHLGNLASYSNFGSAIAIAAPGGDLSLGHSAGVHSTDGRFSISSLVPYFSAQQGTSMASPHVAGVFALMKSVAPNLTANQIRNLLQSGRLTDDLAGNGPRNHDIQFGYGLINAAKAVRAAVEMAGGSSIAPAITAEPGALFFGSNDTSAPIEVNLIGSGSVRVSSVSTNQPWLNIQSVNTDNQGLGTYRVTVSRTGLIPTEYNGEIEIKTNAGDSTIIPAQMRVVESSAVPDVGYLYLLLVDPQLFLTVGQVAIGANNGVYSFSLQNVLDGDYILLAGSDFDKDFFICDPGEACGGYPTRGSLDLFRVNGAPRRNVSFEAGYVVPVSIQGMSSESAKISGSFSSGRRIRPH